MVCRKQVSQDTPKYCFCLFWCAFLIDDNTTLTSHFFFIENSGDFALFKNHLDIFLSRVPDQPTIPGMARAAMSNSSLNQVPLVPNLDQFCPFVLHDMYASFYYILFCFVCLTTTVETRLTSIMSKPYVF